MTHDAPKDRPLSDAHPNLSILRRQMERRVGVEVGKVDVDVLVLEEDLGQVRPAVLRRQVERAVAVVVALVDVRALQQQVLHDPGAAVLGGHVQDLQQKEKVDIRYCDYLMTWAKLSHWNPILHQDLI